MERAAAQAEDVPVMAEIFQNGQFFVETRGLKDNADLAPDRIALRHHIAVEHPHLAGLGRQQGAENSEEGGFAATIRTEEPENFAAVDGQVHRIERDAVAIAVGQFRNRNDRLCISGWHPSVNHAERCSFQGKYVGVGNAPVTAGDRYVAARVSAWSAPQLPAQRHRLTEAATQHLVVTDALSGL